MEQWPENWNAIGEFRSVPEILKDDGYQTALIGKWHLGDALHTPSGYDHWVAYPYGHTVSFYGNTMVENGKEVTVPGHSVDYFTDKAVEYIDDFDPEADRPFFMFLTYNGPFGIWPACQGPAKNRFFPLYQNTEMRSIPREGVHPDAIAYYDLKKDMSSPDIDYSGILQAPNETTSLRNFFSQMSMVDDGVGRVMAALQQNGLDRDTLVVYTADHGLALGQNGLAGQTEHSWPSNTRKPTVNVPLIFRHTNRIDPLRVSDLMVNQTDLAASVLDYVGLGDIELPGSPGKSLAPLLDGLRLDGWHDAAFIEQEETRTIRTRDYLFMKRFRGAKSYGFIDELYDLVADPGEHLNVAQNPEYAETVQLLSDRVDDFFSRFSDPRYDLWKGGTVKSNSDRPWLWKDAWGEDWKGVFE